MTPNSRYAERARRHREMAIGYREDAELLQQRYGKPNSAGALIYESAKQCINAVANQSVQNPGATGSKTRFLESLAARPTANAFDLESGWNAAMQLHLHADRGHLEAVEFQRAWDAAQVFIDDMLAIYAGGE